MTRRRRRAESRTDPLQDKSVVIDRLETNDARLVIIPIEKDKTPKVWAIHHLQMHDLGSPDPWPFQATLTNGVPPGEIDVSGNFGPWHRDEPGDTPLTGVFNFANANLGVFNGIRGHAFVRRLFLAARSRKFVRTEPATRPISHCRSPAIHFRCGWCIRP